LVQHDFFLLWDGASNWQSILYYIRPHLQLRQLDEAGFCDVQAFELKTGKAIGPHALADALDPWLYFHCRK
jgi:hypothetical protein